MNVKYNNKALVLGTNYYIGLSLVRGLGREGVPVVAVDYDPDHAFKGSKYITEQLVVPHYKEDPKGLCRFLIDYAKQQDEKPVLFPTADAYAQFIDEFHDELKSWFLFPNGRKGLVSDLVDKNRMLEYTERFGVRTPEMISTEVPDLAKRVADEIGYPCIIKPAESAPFVAKFRNKVFIINNEEDLMEKVALTNESGMEVYVQRIIPGPETNCYCWEGYMDQNSKCVHYTTVQKIRQWPNNFGAATFAKQKWLPQTHDFCRPFMEGVGYKGFAEIDVKEDVNTGELYLIEVNCRYIGFTELLIQFGFNTPFIAYREMIGDPLPPQAWNYDTGYSWIHSLEDRFARKKYLETGQISKEQMDEDTEEAGIVISPIWSKDDPKPGINYVLSTVKRKATRMVSKITNRKKAQ